MSGSMTLVEFGKQKVLIEAGITQGGTMLQDWRSNTRRLPFKPCEVSYIFIGHCHADHTMLIPRLFAMGCRARIIAPAGTKGLYEIMGADSAHIIQRDAEYLSRTSGRVYDPYYTIEDVQASAAHIEEYGMHDKVALDDNLTVRFVPSGHIINSAQIELWIKNGSRTVKIGYTSDIGGSLPKRYINKFEPIENCNLLIGETTRCGETRQIGPKDRKTDLIKLESVINDTCVMHRHKVLVPVFSLDRAQNILSTIFDIFGAYDTFDIPVLVDSPLCAKLFEYYKTQLRGRELEYYESLLSWKNIVWTTDYMDSKAWQKSDRPAVVLASSGMMQAGRSRQWATTLLPDSMAHIMFCGFATENSLAGKIKHGSSRRTILVDNVRVKNQCGITDLRSFSGHMGRESLLKYYSSVNADKIALVHGMHENKLGFAEDLKDMLCQKNKSTKVVCVNKGTEILI